MTPCIEALHTLLEELAPEERVDLLNMLAEGYCLMVLGCGCDDPRDCTCSTEHRE